MFAALPAARTLTETVSLVKSEPGSWKTFDQPLSTRGWDENVPKESGFPFA